MELTSNPSTVKSNSQIHNTNMTIQELQNRLDEWRTKHGPDALLTSDFGCIEVVGHPGPEIDINNEGTQPPDKEVE